MLPNASGKYFPALVTIVCCLFSLAVHASETEANDETAVKNEIRVGILRLASEGLQPTRRDRFAEEVHRVTLARLGFEPTFEYATYPRLFDHLRGRTLDATSLLTFNGAMLMPENSQLKCSDKPYLALPLALSKLASNKSIPENISFEEIDNFTIGYVRSLGKHNDPFMGKTNYIPSNDLETLFKMLVRGRIDLVLADIIIAKNLGEGLQIETQSVLNVGNLGVLFCVANQWRGEAEAERIANRYISELTAMKRSGELDRLFHEKGIEAYLPHMLPP